MNKNEAALKRTLFIDFESYTENDLEFKNELINLMIGNLNELQQAYNRSIEINQLELFLKTCHKVKTTLSMLDDQEFEAVVEALKNPGVEASRVAFFNNLCAGIITSLMDEKRIELGRTGTM